MKINSAGYDQYQSYVKKVKADEAASGKGRTKAAGAAARADTVMLSDQAAARAEAGRIAAGFAADVENVASPERIQELTAAVQSGTYYVSSEDLADAILDLKA